MSVSQWHNPTQKYPEYLPGGRGEGSLGSCVACVVHVGYADTSALQRVDNIDCDLVSFTVIDTERGSLISKEREILYDHPVSC